MTACPDAASLINQNVRIGKAEAKDKGKKMSAYF